MPTLLRGRLHWLTRARIAALDLLLPPRCASCGEQLLEATSSAPLCSDCRGQLQFIEWPVCPRCAAPVPEANGRLLACQACRRDRLTFDRAFAVGSYEGLWRKLVMRFKGDRSGLMSRAMADLAWERLSGELGEVHADVATAVPMHPWRRLARGVNPPRTLAELLARKLRLPAAGGLLRQRHNIPPQIGLSRPARFRNVSGQMSVRAGYLLRSAHVLLVDDILTTGATCSDAARALKAAGAARVTVVVLARTPLDESPPQRA